MKRIALIEDDYDIRESLRNQFLGSSRIDLEFETDSLEKALLYYRNRTAPHLFLLDINLTGMSGVEGMPLLKRHFPDSLILIHSILDDEDLVFQAICRGASGYLLKTTPHEELEKHILVTLEGGGSPISPSIARRILNHFSQGKHFLPTPQQNQLSETERSIVTLLVDALTYQDIAEKLGMTIDGVRYYVKKIYQKLQIKSRGQLVRLFMDNNMF
ncbi:MAG TPA: response regulator transcription factor [Saprospiraceae bacterium]|nr:response regulator transcription factor [Saprospiraceae bacterium]